MAEPARELLFKPELRKSLDQFVAVNQQLARTKGLTNTSNTTPTMIGSGFAGALGTTGALGFVNPAAWLGTLGLVAGAGANFGMAKLWTSPAFLKWATGFSRALASGSDNAAKSQIGRIGALAAANPELRQPLASLAQHLNDNAMRSAAASNPNAQEQK
jgi:hypothetical protein